MKHLSTAARILTPFAMVVFLSYEMSQSLSVTGGWYALMLVGSFGTAVGIEIVGILAGHTLEGYWRLGDAWRGVLSFALLLVYTLAAVYVLRGNQVLTVVPVVAAIVYILAALSDGLTTAVKKVERAAVVELNHELRNKQADADHKRQMQMEQLRLRHEEKMATIQATPQPLTTLQVAPVNHPTIDTLTAAQRRVYDAIQETPGATYGAIGQRLGITRQAVSKHVKDMNGVMKRL